MTQEMKAPDSTVEALQSRWDRLYELALKGSPTLVEQMLKIEKEYPIVSAKL